MVRAMRDQLEEAARIALSAGEIIKSIYAKDFSVEYKNPRDPVTDADKRANEHIVAALAKAFPGDGIVAEESKDKSDATAGGRVWFVDPLDGTKEFIAKNGEFAVMLGLSVDGVATLGAVYQPAKDKLYTGLIGDGAWLQVGDAKRELRVSDQTDPSKLRLVGSRSHRSKEVGMTVERLGITDERVSGSVGVKVGLIAEQSVDLYVHMSDRSSHWDACGPEAILGGAGGIFTRVDGQQYAYGGEDLRTTGGIFACNAAAYEKVLPVVRAIAEETGFLS